MNKIKSIFNKIDPIFSIYVIIILSCIYVLFNINKLDKMHSCEYKYEIVNKKSITNTDNCELLLYNKQYNSYLIKNYNNEQLYNVGDKIIVKNRPYKIENIYIASIFKDAGILFNICFFIILFGFIFCFVCLSEVTFYIFINIPLLIFSFITICFCLY